MIRLAMRFLAKKPRVAFGLPYLLLSYFTLACLWCGRTDGRMDVRSRDDKSLPKVLGCIKITKFSYLRCSAIKKAKRHQKHPKKNQHFFFLLKSVIIMRIHLHKFIFRFSCFVFCFGGFFVSPGFWVFCLPRTS